MCATIEITMEDRSEDNHCYCHHIHIPGWWVEAILVVYDHRHRHRKNISGIPGVVGRHIWVRQGKGCQKYCIRVSRKVDGHDGNMSLWAYRKYHSIRERPICNRLWCRTSGRTNTYNIAFMLPVPMYLRFGMVIPVMTGCCLHPQPVKVLAVKGE